MLEIKIVYLKSRILWKSALTEISYVICIFGSDLTKENSPRRSLFFLETGSEELNGCCVFFRKALNEDRIPPTLFNLLTEKALRKSRLDENLSIFILISHLSSPAN